MRHLLKVEDQKAPGHVKMNEAHASIGGVGICRDCELNDEYSIMTLMLEISEPARLNSVD